MHVKKKIDKDSACAIYALHSVNKCKDVSVEEQIDACNQFAIKHGWKIEENHIYADKITEFDRSKPQREALFKVILKRKIDFVLVADITRLFTNIKDILSIQYLLDISIVPIFDAKPEGSKGVSKSIFVAELRKMLPREWLRKNIELYIQADKKLKLKKVAAINNE